MARNPRPALRRIIAGTERVQARVHRLTGDDLDQDELQRYT